jgi:hypothetical protein
MAEDRIVDIHEDHLGDEALDRVDGGKLCNGASLACTRH